MFDDIIQKKEGFYDEMKEKLENETVDYFGELMDIVDELADELEQVEIDV